MSLTSSPPFRFAKKMGIPTALGCLGRFLLLTARIAAGRRFYLGCAVMWRACGPHRGGAPLLQGL